jgi:hypothetical protein
MLMDRGYGRVAPKHLAGSQRLTNHTATFAAHDLHQYSDAANHIPQPLANYRFCCTLFLSSSERCPRLG